MSEELSENLVFYVDTLNGAAGFADKNDAVNNIVSISETTISNLAQVQKELREFKIYLESIFEILRSLPDGEFKQSLIEEITLRQELNNTRDETVAQRIIDKIQNIRQTIQAAVMRISSPAAIENTATVQALENSVIQYSSEIATLRSQNEEQSIQIRNLEANNSEGTDLNELRQQLRILNDNMTDERVQYEADKQALTLAATDRIRQITNLNTALRARVESNVSTSTIQLQGLRDTVQLTEDDILETDKNQIQRRIPDILITVDNLENQPLEYAFNIFNLETSANVPRFLLLLHQLRRGVDVNDIYSFMAGDIDIISLRLKHFTNDYLRLITEVQHAPPYRQRFNITKYLRSIIYGTTTLYQSGLVNEADFMASDRKASILIYNDATLAKLAEYRDFVNSNIDFDESLNEQYQPNV